jgi:ribosomal protein L11 methyltransferase (prmA)
MKKTWYEIYIDEINEKGSINNYVNDKIKTKKNLINLIKKYSPNKKIIEAGSGTGILSTYLASLGFDSVAIDIDKDILNLSKKIAKEYGAKNKPKFMIDSILKLNYKNKEFDVSFSNGVLEHFSDKEIIETIKKQLKIANTVVVGIPTKYFDDNEAMYGDERFLKLKFWREIISQADGKIIEEKSCHFLTKSKILLNFKKYFRPFPYRIFVIQEK